MGVIIGKGFRDYVTKQINTRQEKLGLNDRDDNLLKYINTKTSWLRLTSGVDVDSSKTLELGVRGQEGNKLAINNVLSSAIKYDSSTLSKPFTEWKPILTSGVAYSDNSSYGYNSDFNYGLVPPPGIISADVKSLNRGSLKEVNIQITCHNLQQFKIIETLYLRLGYSILLEWGHTLWFDNTGEFRNDMPDWVHRGFLNGDYSQEVILNILTAQRGVYNGNYDGFFGVVVNFDWEIRKDGGYNISIKAKSVGDIIESLKINSTFPTLSTNPITYYDSEGNKISRSEAEKKTEIPTVVANSDRSTLDTLLYGTRDLMDDSPSIKPGVSDGYSKTFLSTNNIVSATGLKANYFRTNEVDLSTVISGYRALFSGLSQDDEGKPKSDILYYITLGTLLRIIENFLSVSNLAGDKKPIFFMDYNSDDNLCFTIPRQLSVDPNVCLIPIGDITAVTEDTPPTVAPYVKIVRTSKELRTAFVPGIDVGGALIDELFDTTTSEITTEPISVLPVGVKLNEIVTETNSDILYKYTVSTVYYDINSTIDIIDKEYRTSFETLRSAIVDFVLDKAPEGESNVLNNIDSNVFRTTNPYIGKTMGILVNLNYISSTLDSFIDEEGKLSLYDFLKNLMIGIQSALGSVNSFEVIYTSEDNTFSIIDNTFIPGVFDYLKLPKPEIAKFNPNLLKPNYGSFITDVGIKSKLDNKFTAMITIGAQVNGNAVGENATAFSRWNVGLTDRIITVKQNLNDPNSSSIPVSGSVDPKTAYEKNITALFEYRNRLNEGNISIDDVNNNRQNIVDVFKYEIGYMTEKRQIPGVGFIPLSLDLTFDGLSGIRIYDVYNIDETLLPENYKNNIQFTATGVSHKIDKNGWKTSLESISGPKQDVSITTTVGLTSVKSKSTTDVKKAEKLLKEGGCSSLSSTKLKVAESVLKEANIRGIKDKNRLTCLLTVAYAEAGFTLKKTEDFRYRVDRIGTGTDSNWNGDASIIFKKALLKAGIDVPNGLEKILSNPSDSLANYVYANRGKNGGPSSKDGSRYRGRGMTQTTFKSGYQSTQDTLKKYNINIDLISNPDNIFQYEIPVLVIGKLEGLYGKKLSSGVDYINNATNIAQTQNGGDKKASDNYINALNCINNNPEIQELISKYS